MSKAGKQVVGIFAFINGAFNLIFAFMYLFFIGLIADFFRDIPLIGDIIRNLVYESLLNIVGGQIVLMGFVLVGILWIILGIGLFMDQGWAVLITKILAILYLIGSILTCNCIGFILAIIVLYLLKSEKEKREIYIHEKHKAPDRRCTNCGREIPFDSMACPYCGKKFETFFKSEQKPIPPAKHDKKSKEIEEKTKKEEETPASTLNFCPECGTKLEDNPKFCPECGTKI